MAKKRMFSSSIVEDDVFLDMPLSSQSLYFHLCMNADDEGFVSPKRIMRMIGATLDDLKILISKRYILVFDSGVAVIKHWHKNNNLRKDRLLPTTYQHELKSLTFNEWGVYTEKRSAQTSILDDNKITTVNSGESPAIVTNDNQMATQYSIDKVSIGKYSNTTKVVLAKTPSVDIDEMFNYWETTIGYPISANRKRNRYAASNLLKKYGKDKVKQLIDGVMQTHSDRYAPNISDFCALQSKLNELLVWGRKRNNNTGVEVIS